MTEEIKPCPFCGSEIEEKDFVEEWIGWWVTCPVCDSLPVPTTKEEAMQQWNQRPYDYDMPAIVKKVERLEEENKKLRISLYAYSNQYNWTRGYVWAGDDNNGYELAKSTLEELKSCKQPE